MAKQRFDSKGNLLPNGVYESRSKLETYYIKYDGPKHADGRRNPKEEHGFSSINKALKAKMKREDEVQNGSLIVDTKQTLGEFLTEYLTKKRSKVKQGTMIGYNITFGTIIKSELGKIPLVKLKAMHIEDYFLNRIESETDPISPNTAHEYLTRLKSALKYAKKMKKINDSPADLVELPKKRKKKITILSPQEINALLEQTKNKIHYDMLIVYLFSGARRGEVLGLRESDIDFERNKVTFTNSIVTGENSEVIIQDSLKNDASTRTISLDPIAMAALKHQLLKRSKDKLRAGQSYQDNGLIFAKPDGTPYSPKAITMWFIRRFAAFGRSDCSLHTLRHTHISTLLASGVDPVSVSKRVGHASVKMTLDVYGHFIPEKDEETAVLFAEILKKEAI